MPQKIYVVDAFADRLFAGNPAAVCPLDHWPDDRMLQQIAMENNLAETAFYVPAGDGYELRWFTPTVEVDLCGHATLAAAFVLFTEEGYAGDTVHFHSPRSGPLSVSILGDTLTLDFPADEYRALAFHEDLDRLCGIAPLEAYRGKTDLMLVFSSEREVRMAQPDFGRIGALDARGLIITAKGDAVDFVSRFFAPQSGINEDPVTGSAHTTLAPYWAGKMGKERLTARQLSARGGNITCSVEGSRVLIGGQARLYLKGEIFV